MACGCQNQNSFPIENSLHAGTATLVEMSYCPDLNQVLALKVKIDEILNSGDESLIPEDLSFQDLVDSISPLNHTITTQQTCGNASIIEFLLDKISI